MKGETVHHCVSSSHPLPSSLLWHMEEAYNKRHLVSSVLSTFVALNNVIVMDQQIMVNFCYSSCCYWTVTEIRVEEHVSVTLAMWWLASYQTSGHHNSRKQTKSWKQFQHGFSRFYNCGYSCICCSISKFCPACRLSSCWKRDFSTFVSYCTFPTLLNVAESEQYLSEVYIGRLPALKELHESRQFLLDMLVAMEILILCLGEGDKQKMFLCCQDLEKNWCYKNSS